MPRIKAMFTAYSDLLQLLSSDSDLLAKYKAVLRSLPSVKANGADTMGLTAEKLAATEPRVGNVFRNAGASGKAAAIADDDESDHERDSEKDKR